jgi:hypothetical protein
MKRNKFIKTDDIYIQSVIFDTNGAEINTYINAHLYNLSEIDKIKLKQNHQSTLLR